MKTPVLLITILFALLTSSFAEFVYVSPDIGDLKVFSRDSFYYWDISEYRVDIKSEKYIKSIGPGRALDPDFGEMRGGLEQSGIPYTVIDRKKNQYCDIELADTGKKDKYNFPMDVLVENKANGRFIVIDKENHKLLEFFYASKRGDTIWVRKQAIYDLSADPICTEGLNSDEPAAIPIFPFLVRYEEADKGEINHALRLIVGRTQRKYIYPAQRYGTENTDEDLPPLGLRLRLKKDFAVEDFPKCAKAILLALKKHGAVVCGGGGGFAIAGAPDKRWDEGELSMLTQVKASDFEVVESASSSGSPIYPSMAGSLDAVGNIKVVPNPMKKGGRLKFVNLPFGEITIMILGPDHKLLKEIISKTGNPVWDGKDPDGNICEPGVYKALINDSKRKEKTLYFEIIK